MSNNKIYRTFANEKDESKSKENKFEIECLTFMLYICNV